MNQIIPTDWIRSIFENFCSFMFGIAMTAIGFFIPIKNIVHLLIFFFMLDVIFGYLAARKLRGERFSVKIIWNHTIPRMLISLVLILGAFMWDKTYEQDFISTYKLIGWFISGVLLYSIAENGYKITHWYGFLSLKAVFRKKFEDETGTTINNK